VQDLLHPIVTDRIDQPGPDRRGVGEVDRVDEAEHAGVNALDDLPTADGKKFEVSFRKLGCRGLPLVRSWG